MQPDEQLIDRFYQGNCTPEEAQQVMNWLLENETEPSLAKDWSEVSPSGKYPEQFQAAMLEHIRQSTHRAVPRVRGIRRIHWAGWSVAASFVLVVGLALFGLQQGKKSAVTVQRSTVVVRSPLAALEAPANRPLTIRMVDGSTVVLEPRAILRFDSASYNKQERVVSLEGQAVFFVAHNRSKPFSVNANGFSTTALGTSFLVAAKPTGDIKVRLFTGKVVIRQLEGAHPLVKDVYLTPGEELVFSGIDLQPLVNRWLPEVLPAKERKETMIAQTKAVRFAGDTLVFENAQLKTVLDVLEHRYHVNIHYNPHSVSDAYFTGSVLPGDAIELILRTVTRINGLTLVAAGDGFIIK